MKYLKIGFTGYYGFKNLGDEILLNNILTFLNDNHKATYFRIFTNRELDLNISSKIKVDFVYKQQLKNPINFCRYIFKIMSCDLYVYTGGAVISNKSVLINSLFIFIASLFRTKVIVLPVGVSPVHKNKPRWLLKFLWKNVKYVSVRDKDSYRNLDWYAPKEIKPDLAFLPRPKKIKALDTLKQVGFNPRRINHATDHKIKAFYLSLAQCIGKDVVYLIYSTSTGQNNNQDDSAICTQLCKELNDKGFKARYVALSSINDLTELQQSLSINFACRLHAFLESLVLGVPSFILDIEEIGKIRAIIRYLEIDDTLTNVALKPDIEKIMATDFKSISNKVFKYHEDIASTVNKIFRNA